MRPVGAGAAAAAEGAEPRGRRIADVEKRLTRRPADPPTSKLVVVPSREMLHNASHLMVDMISNRLLDHVLSRRCNGVERVAGSASASDATTLTFFDLGSGQVLWTRPNSLTPMRCHR